ncbi:unnamed protein product [Ilex paraguariensis]|uniref:Scarecrow-like protein 14 n=1 Tax=Ilex paraguariensis TaxID=185542 RepID=A0ABC8R3W2_9AQUA
MKSISWAPGYWFFTGNNRVFEASMVMDPRFSEFSDSANGFNFDDATILPSFDKSQNLTDVFKIQDDSFDISFMDVLSLPTSPDFGTSFTSSSSVSSELNSPDDHDSDPVLKFLNQILLEENIEEKPSMFHDPLALQATEKSLYEVLGEKYPPSPYHPPSISIDQNVESPGDYFGSSSDTTNSGSSGGTSIDPHRIVDPGDYILSMRQSHSLEYPFQSNLQTISQWSFGTVNSFSDDAKSQWDSSASPDLVPNIFSDRESILQFKKGMEEASKFLPSGNQLIIDLDRYNLPLETREAAPEVVVKMEKDKRDYSPDGSRGRKHHHPGNSDLEEERSSKQSAVYVEEAELSEVFDKVLLFNDEIGVHASCNSDTDKEVESLNGPVKSLQQNGQPHGSSGGKTRGKKQGNKIEAVDLRTLLINCAQSVAADDRRTAYEQLKQIRHHSSPSGDAYQRLAYIFANGLEARLAGTGTQRYAALASNKRISAAEKLKAYQLYFSACPFKKISMFFANKMIFDMASSASTLHIVDFGISYGFQWPMVIQHLPTRPGGPPKLRITGIELPQPGFRPSELLEETGRRLAKYCERFNVPFEYHAIATQNWETIKVEDLKIRSGEMLAVNCMFRFGNLLDETVDVDSPRDAVLKLIRQMNPDIFIHALTSGSYSAPFFVTRFREALFHYSSLFDMFETNISRDNQLRMDFEQEFYGREAMNVIACEGAERVERPETYKQWQVRTMRAGFKPLPLDQHLLKKLRGKVQAGYHQDFVFDEDSYWMLQGWKGRISCASSCWVPA